MINYEEWMDCSHSNMICQRDGEFHKEICPDCGYELERDETYFDRLVWNRSII